MSALKNITSMAISRGKVSFESFDFSLQIEYFLHYFNGTLALALDDF